MVKIFTRSIVAFLWLFIAFSLNAQSYKHLSGYIRDKKTGLPLENATVIFGTNSLVSFSQNSGFFEFDKVPLGMHRLQINLISYNPINIELNLLKTDEDTLKININLESANLSIQEIVVTAKDAKLGSISVIEKSAIEFVQPVSLADALQLIAGQPAQNSDLSGVQQINLRQATTTNRANALGTAILLDGVPVSNNANLQSNIPGLNTGSPNTLPPFSSAEGRGVDLRQIPADQIERIEVIRGVPSAKYGDLSSGAILVETRLGTFAPQLRVRFNPNLIQTALGYGFKLNNSNIINLEIDYANSQDSPTDAFNYYQRLSTNLAWTRYWNKKKTFATTSRLSLYGTLDARKLNPDDIQYQRKVYAQDQGLRAQTKGDWKIGHSFFKQMSYTLSANYAHQKGFFQEKILRDIFPLSPAISDTTLYTGFGTTEYLNQTSVDGKPLNLYGRLQTSAIARTGECVHILNLGTEWRTDVNFGNGRQFDPTKPPRQNYSMGDRPRSYKQIPALHQLSFYLEDQMNFKILSKSVHIQAGLRSDHIRTQFGQKYNWKNIVSPRLNMGIELNNWIALRGGLGRMAKTPTLSFLYPAPRFYDLANLNYYANNPAERLAIVSTRILVPNTENLKPFQSEKWEIGADFNIQDWNLSTTYFQENVSNAIDNIRLLKPLLVDKYAIASAPIGQQPTIRPEPLRTDTFFAAYDEPQNALNIKNKGLEFQLEGQILKKYGASFQFSGAWIQTRIMRSTPFLNANYAVFSTQQINRVPIFAPGQMELSERFLTSLRLIERLPNLNFIGSVLIQTTWIERNRLADYSTLPTAYLNTSGQTIPITSEQAQSESFRPLQRRINPKELEWQNRPILWLINCRLAKEWAEGRGFAFYVNNVWAKRAFFTSNLSGLPVERAYPSLFFGGEIYVRL